MEALKLFLSEDFGHFHIIDEENEFAIKTYEIK